MKLFVVVVLFSLLAVSYANIFEQVFSDPEHPGKCVRDGIILLPGEQKEPVGKCERFICNRADGFGTVLSCDQQVFHDGCHMGDQVHPEADFPFCCARHEICH